MYENLKKAERALGRRPLLLVCLAFMAVLIFLNALGLPLVPETPDVKALHEHLISGENEVRLTGFVKTRRITDEYSFVVLEDVKVTLGGEVYAAGNVRVTLTEPAAYAIGTFIGAAGELKETEKPTNPGQFDRAFYYKVQKIGFLMSRPRITVLGKQTRPLSEAVARVRERVTARLAEVYPEDAEGPLGAMIAGDRSSLSEEDTAWYRMGGVSHMLAISGLHITVLAMGLYRILTFLHLDYRAAAAVSAVFISLYAAMTGLSAATVRAVIMFLFLMGAKLAKRTYDLPTAAAFAAILLLLDNPYYLFYSGFILSFGAVLCLHVFTERSRFAGGVILALLMMPAVLWFFYEIPILGVPVNLVIVPLLPLLLVLGGAGLLLGGVFALPAVFLIRLIRRLLVLCAGLPWASLILGRPSAVRIVLYYAALFVFLYLYSIYRTKKRRFALLLLIPFLVLILGFRPRTGIRLTFLDVGQGDSAVAELPGGETVLTDGGSSTVLYVGNERILPFLKYEGIRHLDYIFVTHMDTDHTSGITEILTAVRDKTTSLTVGCVALPYLAETDETYREMANLAREAGARVIRVRAGDEITFKKGAALEVLGPDPAAETVPPDKNAQCIVHRISLGAFDALMTGDAEGAGEEALLQKLLSEDVDYEVLKVAHHGSNNSTPEKLLACARPEIAVISVGKGNGYGHPGGELLSRLAEGSREILRTDINGAVTVFSDGKGVHFETMKP